MILHKLFTGIIITLSLALTGYGQNDTLIYSELTNDLYFFDNGSEGYVPLISSAGFQKRSLHIDINRGNHSGTFLRLSSKAYMAVLIDNQLICSIKPSNSEVIWSVDSLLSKFSSNSIRITLYARRLNPENINAQLITFGQGSDKSIGDEVIILDQRRASDFNDFFIIALLVLSAWGAALYNYYPKTFNDFIRFKRAMAIREMDENLLKSRPFTRINLLFYLFFSFLIALVLVIIFSLSDLIPAWGMEIAGFWGFLWFWSKAGLAVFVWFIGKYLLLSNFTSIFRLKEFLLSHHYNYIRMGLLAFSLILITLVFSFFIFNFSAPAYYAILLKVLLTGLVLRTLIIFFKLLNVASFKIYHLISYLCGTELIPLSIIIIFGINQPF